MLVREEEVTIQSVDMHFKHQTIQPIRLSDLGDITVVMSCQAQSRVANMFLNH